MDICLTEVSSYFSSKIGALECFEEIFELKELDVVCFGLIFADFLNADVDLKYVNEPSCEARFLDTAFLEADLSKSVTNFVNLKICNHVKDFRLTLLTFEHVSCINLYTINFSDMPFHTLN